MNHIFESKDRGIRQWLASGCGIFVYFLCLTIFRQNSNFEGIRGLVYGLVLFLYGVAARKGKKSELAIFSLAWGIIGLISAYLMFGVLGFVTDVRLQALIGRNDHFHVQAFAVVAVLRFLMGRGIAFVRKNRNGRWSSRQDWAVASLFLFLFIFVWGMFLLERDVLSRQEEYSVSLAFFCGIFGALLIVMLFYQRVSQEQKEAGERRQLEQKQEIQGKQMEELYEIGRQANRLRHDMQIQLDTIYGLLEQHGYEKAKECIRKLGAQWAQYPELPHNTGNQGLNAALMKAIQTCKEKRIDFHYVVLGKPKEIDEMDMANLMDNLLRNAIEACEPMAGKGKIEIAVKTEQGVVEIEVENTIQESVLMNNPMFKTTKAEKEKHGFGMDSIESIVKQYHGNYECKEEKIEQERFFVQNLWLRISEEKICSAPQGVVCAEG